MKIKPLTQKLRATTFFRAFLLNAINVSLSTFFGYISHFYLEKHTNIPVWGNILISLSIAFSSCLLVHFIMFYTFGFGGSMLVEESKKIKYDIHKGMKN